MLGFGDVRYVGFGSLAEVEVCITSVCFVLQADILKDGFHVR